MPRSSHFWCGLGQVLHYVNGQKYEPHHDFFHDKYNAREETGGQRVATVLMYLYVPVSFPCSIAVKELVLLGLNVDARGSKMHQIRWL